MNQEMKRPKHWIPAVLLIATWAFIWGAITYLIIK